ncbi:hypothetical protein NE236_16360 [Actinoallomurus purpureus]|uniref:hypothetical protein n=1 Tax=Actinoallomurus purpureus TaxID=478114 RepID=UPI0020920CC7|nr:hypothetical protein [Actinoallomurus purpureus]MCO6006559.1 hypothetical protein [Actinoallomurus purpureus]
MNQATEELEPDPVFVDPTGRRAKIMRRAGIALGCLVAAYLALITVGLATGARVPLTPWPQTKHSKSGPAEDGLMPRSGARNPLPGRSSAAGVPPSGPAPTTATSHAPTGGTRSAAPGTTAPATPGSPTPPVVPTTATTAPGKGHGYGRTKKPHPGTT